MKTIKFLILVQFVYLITGCAPSIPQEVKSFMITPNDVPSGWISTGENFDERWGGDVYIVGFGYGDDTLSPRITHSIVVYSDEVSAIEGYEEYKKSIYRDFWFIPTEVEFVPSSQNDLYVYKCADSVKVNDSVVFDCLALQQHDNYVSVVSIRIGTSVTLDSFNHILHTVDNSLNN